MRKEISYSQFQQVKSAAKMIDPNMRKIEALKKKIVPLVSEMQQLKALNDSLEAGIVSVIGFHVADLVKKVIEPTGALDKLGKPIKVTKYLPTDIVTYDEQKKVYVISMPEVQDQPASDAAPESFQHSEDAGTSEVQAEQDQPEEVASQPASSLPWENQ